MIEIVKKRCLIGSYSVVTDGSAVVHFDFQFSLFDALMGGAQQGTTQPAANILVTNGIFSVNIDFGACATCFDGSPRFLEIAVRPHSADPNNPPYTMLAPRQPVSATPYAIRSLNASQLDGQPASGFIQNTTSQ